MDAPVLLTGATGYIGGRLLRHFEEAGRPVRCLARNPERVRATRSTTEVVLGDCLDEESLDLGFRGVGIGRGRRDPENCGLTDVIDGWTVDAYEPDRRLRLRADLSIPDTAG